MIPTFDEIGLMVSVQARLLTQGTGPKSLWPKNCRSSGVFADPLGRGLLLKAEIDELESGQGRLVILAEGVPDFLTYATVFMGEKEAPAVLGFVAGTWSQAVASRVPDGSHVVIAAHVDRAGGKYKEKILQTFEGRNVKIKEVCHGE
ncbi:MAG: hypothetical protein JW395_0696 [Nitrospira sp.]|nr:hypothetical protein [Nitrospira sp.]